MSDASSPGGGPSRAERLRELYRQWEESKGTDSSPFFAIAADDIEMDSVLVPPGFSAMAGEHKGLARAKQYFAALTSEWEMIDFPTERLVEQGDTVVWIGRCTWKNRHTGVVVATPKIDVWTFAGDKAVRFYEMFDTLGFARGMGIMLAAPPPPKG